MAFKEDWLKKVESKISSFIWASKGARIAWKKLRQQYDKGGLRLPDLSYYAWVFLLKGGKLLSSTPDSSNTRKMIRAMLFDVKGGEYGFIHKYGDPRFFKKVCLKTLQSFAVTWHKIRRESKLNYYSGMAPIWDSPGFPEWSKDCLALPLREAGIITWGQLKVDGVLISWEEAQEIANNRLSRFKYLQIKSWSLTAGSGTGLSNKLESRMMTNVTRKKRGGELVLAFSGDIRWRL